MTDKYKPCFYLFNPFNVNEGRNILLKEKKRKIYTRHVRKCKCVGNLTRKQFKVCVAIF